MNVEARMQLTMSQRLVMTPMLQQAIKLLQMSRLELVDLVKQELLENPVLDEFEENEFSANAQEMRGEADSQAPFAELGQNESGTPNVGDNGFERPNSRQETTVNWEEYFEDNPAGLGGYAGEQERVDQQQTYDNIESPPQSLAEHLIWQLQMSRVPERVRRIGTFLIGQIDENGYIRGDVPLPSNLDLVHHPFEVERLQEYRAQVIEGLQQKINVAFEREHVLTTLDTSNVLGLLAHTLLQEYYEDVSRGQHELIVAKLQALTLADLEMLMAFMADLAVADLAVATGLARKEIAAGLQQMRTVGRDVRELLEQSLVILIKGRYETKLEKMQLAAEELHLVEYVLLQLSTEEVTYLAAKDRSAKMAKREKDIAGWLEGLRQSYAHIDTLQSPKYRLIQLYRAGLGLLREQFRTAGSGRIRKLGLKLQQVTVAEVAKAAEQLAVQTVRYYETAQAVSAAEVEYTLRHIQTFAPPGIGARDVQECLTIQARNLGISELPVERLIQQYLPELQRRQYAQIAGALGVSLDTVELVAKMIANMSPRPGADFTAEPPEYITPDIYVYKVDGAYEVVLNEDDLPSLRINPVYKKLLGGTNQAIPNATKQYVDQKLRSAMWFIRSVEQRKRTIYKVGKSIVKFQHAFLEQGISHLKPLVLRDVADDIAMHESTVSRVTTNKYIHTPQGVFELKYFFHSGLESSSGHDISSLAVKERIKQLILEEKPARPLSDQALEKILTAQGIAIARRTIAKYREELNIPSSVNRKHRGMNRD